MFEKGGIMKPKLRKLIICIFFFGALAGISYLGGYLFALDFFKFDNLRSMDEELLKNPVLDNKPENTEAGMNESAFVRSDTLFVLQDFNLETEETHDNKMVMPIEYLGMNMYEVADYISKNYDKYKEEDIDLVNVMLISFSDDKMVIRRCYYEIKEEETTSEFYEDGEIKYYIMENNGYVTIYKADKVNIFLNTEILMATLAPEDIELIKEGIGVKDIFEMYGYLESFTS